VKYRLEDGLHYGYIHLIESGNQSVLKVNGVQLEEGDGAFMEKLSEMTINSVGVGAAEFLFFALP
jgi:hypothetical protein